MRGTLMNHKTHIFFMVGLVAAAVVLLSTGFGGEWVLFALLGGCAVMMFFMMRGMGGMGGDQSDGSPDTTTRTTGDRHH